MSDKNTPPGNAAASASSELTLRQRAEAAFRERAAQSPEPLGAMSPEATQQTLHELRVHQIELEMQNEELRRAHVELDASRAGYFDLYHLAPVGYCTLSEQGLILQANLTAATQLGVARGPLAGQPLSRFIHKEDGDNYHLLRKKLIETGEPQSCELRMVKHDGTQFWAHLASTVTPDAGGLPVIRVVMDDVTDCKLLQIQAEHAEEEIRQLNASLEQRVRERTAQLETAVKELDGFSHSISHDLRAPLRHIHGYVKMLTRAIAGQLAEDPRRYLQTITDSSVEMGQLIDDLLAFSRMSRAEMSATHVLLDGLVEDTIRGLEMAVQGRNIVWKIAPLPPVVGDLPMLRQVLANLIGNAVKYTRPRNPAQIEIGVTGEEDGRTIFFVRDNGVGFDMQYAHKLFGVFQRLHRAEEFEGTGIGLATVRRVIARHGGRTWAEGKLDEGATFYFTLKPAVAV